MRTSGFVKMKSAIDLTASIERCEKMPRKNSLASLMMLITSMLIFGTIGVFRRLIPLSSGLIASIRGLAGALVLILFIKLRGRKIRTGIGRKTALLLIFSGAVIGFNWILLFESYNYTTVPVATLCYYMQPTIVVIASTLLFREKMTPRKAVCSILALAGMFLISGVAEGGNPPASEIQGILLGLGAAVLYSTVVLMNKVIRKVDPFEKTIIQLFSAGAVLIPYLMVTEDVSKIRFTPQMAGLLAIVVIVHTGIAYALYFGSMDGLRTQTVALFSYIDPVTALLLSAMILHERMTPGGIIGAVMIIGSAIACEL